MRRFLDHSNTSRRTALGYNQLPVLRLSEASGGR